MSNKVKDEPEKADRRKLMGQAIPFALKALWEARSAISPARLTTEALDQYSKVEAEGKLQRNELQAVLEEILRQKIHLEGAGKIALTLSREEVLTLIGRILKRQFAGEGANRVELDILPHDSGRDAILPLLTRNVSVKLYLSSEDAANLQSDLEEAKKDNPSELWIFSWLPSLQERNLRFDPVFLSESRILRGRLRVQPIGSIFNEITEGNFSATLIGVDQDGRSKFLLSPRGTATPKSGYPRSDQRRA